MPDPSIPTTSAESDPNLQSKTVFLTTSTGGHLVTIPPQNLAERRYANARVRKAPPSKEYPGHDQPNAFKAPAQHQRSTGRKIKTEIKEEVEEAVPVVEAPAATKTRRSKKVKVEEDVKVLKVKPPPKKPGRKKKSPAPPPVPKQPRKRKKSPVVVVKEEILEESPPTKKKKVGRPARIKQEVPEEPPEVKQEVVDPESDVSVIPEVSPPRRKKKRARVPKPKPIVLYEPDWYHAPSEDEKTYVPYIPPVPRHWEILPCENYDLADVLTIHPSLESIIEEVRHEDSNCILYRKLELPDAENLPPLPLEDPAPYSCYLQTANPRAHLSVVKSKRDPAERLNLLELKQFVHQKYPPSTQPAILYYLEFVSDQSHILSRGSTVTQYVQSLALARCFCETLGNKVEVSVLEMVDFTFQYGNREVVALFSVLLRFINSLQMARSVIKSFLKNCQKSTSRRIELAVNVPVVDPYFNLIARCPFIKTNRLPELVVVIQNVDQKRYSCVDYTVFHDEGYKHLWEAIQIYFPRKGYDVREIVVQYGINGENLPESVDYICRTLRQCVYNYSSVTVIGLGSEALLAHKACSYVDGLNALICVNPEMSYKDTDVFPRVLQIPIEDYSNAYCPTMWVIGEDHRHSVFKDYFDSYMENVSTGYAFFCVDKADKFMKIRETTLLEHRITQSIVNRIVLDQMHYFLTRKARNKQCYLTSNEPHESRDRAWAGKAKKER
uniref:SRR1 domain-containing protein n=1 Tax=Panagrellus redivivus TaxID=6233 RepID=A0A7E4WAS3_PANRE